MVKLNKKTIKTLTPTPISFGELKEGKIFVFNADSDYLFMKTSKIYGYDGYSSRNAIDLQGGDSTLVSRDETVFWYDVGLVFNGNLIGK